jgi:superfamily II DNA/RNA helicase
MEGQCAFPEHVRRMRSRGPRATAKAPDSIGGFNPPQSSSGVFTLVRRRQPKQERSILMTTFTQLGVPAELVDALARRGVTAPFPIQQATIADALAGRDLCGRAPTGSGKTLAFAIPLVLGARRGSPRRPSALVLVPTRELAAQVAAEMRPLAEARGRSVATFYGGTNLTRDQRTLRRGVDIAIACPGRLADLVRRRDADLRDVRFVVIDEADRMSDMGFLPEVKRLLDQTASDRQTLLFSATLDGEVDVLVRRYQHDPARHELAAAEEDASDVRHFFWHAVPAERVGIARDIVNAVAPAIVFTRTKHSADRVAKQLNRLGVRAAAIHGNRSQSQRERALADFTGGRVAALVATDVAARGIHVDGVGVVVHFDPPATGKDYVHRSGRTGRAGASGLVVTLVAPDKVGDVRGMQRSLAMRQHVEQITLGHLTDGTAAGARLDQQGSDNRVAAPPARPGRSSQAQAVRGNAAPGGAGSGRRRRGNGRRGGRGRAAPTARR